VLYHTKQPAGIQQALDMMEIFEENFGQSLPAGSIVEYRKFFFDRKDMLMPTVSDIVVRKPSTQEIQSCQKWPIWTCGVSTFEWEYTQTEKCLILEGQVTVSNLPDNGQTISFGPGDYVQFPNGLKYQESSQKALRF